MDYMEKAWEVSKKVAAFYAEERYTDKYGHVWLGVEGETHDKDQWVREDGLKAISSAAMMKKMINELMDWEATPVEDPYEYAVQTTDHTGQAFDPGEYGWVSTLEGAEILLQDRLDRWLKRNVDWTAKIVKRRKAGRVEDV